MLSTLTRNLSEKSASSVSALCSTSSHLRLWGMVSLLSIAGMTSGCGGGATSGVKAGPISTVTAAGVTAPGSALSIGSPLKLSMMPSGDNADAGVDWTVTCGGNPVTGSITNGACGTLSPTHTADGAATTFTAPSAVPIGTSITITASVTSDPSQTSDLRLTILPTPVAISFSNAVTSLLEIGGTENLTASVTNDPVGAGVAWIATCGSGACGSFNPTTTASGANTVYTAPAAIPAGGAVTITATSLTDTTKSASATITVTGPPPPPPPPVPIAVNILTPNVYVAKTGPARSASLAAVVTNDPSSAGVDWTLSCDTSNCGTISGHTASGGAATFNNTSTVAVGGTITITAKSTADPTKSASATATVVATAPTTVTMSTTSPLPATIEAGAQATLAAAASPDTGSAGVNWTATCGSAGACGTFNLSPAHTASNGKIIYTAPQTVPTGSVVTIVASWAGTSPANSVFSTTTIVASPPPPLTLSFAQSPPTTLVSAAQAPVSVTVANDIAPGGVLWTAQCGSTAPGGCGWFAPTQTASGATAIYTAPPVTAAGTSVTLIATSIADPSISISSSPITITPDATLKVNFVPSLPSQVQMDATINLNAAVANDLTAAGVDWQVCANGCGFFTLKPAIPAIPATATTPFVPATPAVTATTVSAWPNGLPIPYTAPSQAPTSGSVAVVASAHVSSAVANSGTVAITSALSGPALNGTVQAGGQPVVGALVALYAASTAGYGTLSTQVASSSPTDKNGGFTLAAGYSCPQPGSQMYLVATGGSVGSNEANQNLALMTALGSCGNLSSTPVVLNEITSIASAIAIAPFAADDALTGNSSYLYVGTSNGNAVGLANAFSAVNNLVDISTGNVRFSTPRQNAIVPYVEINTLADILSACAATAGGVKGDGSACSTLFSATDLLGTGSFPSSIAPADTLQAAFNIAQHPVANYGYNLDLGGTLITLVSLQSSFQPILTKQPNDWSISLNYTTGGGLSANSAVSSFAIDATGNLWITDTNAGTVIEWNPTGAALSPSTGFLAGGGPIAIDATGNAWISGAGALSELSNLGTPLPWSPFGGVPGGGSDAAFDAQSNIWIANTVGVSEFNSLGLQLSPVGGYTLNGIANFTAVGIDSSNNVWLGASANGQIGGHLAEVTNPGAQIITSSLLNGSGTAEPQMAADGAGDIWFIGGGDVCEGTPFEGRGSTLIPNCLAPGGSAGGGAAGINVMNPAGIALDGAGTVWVGSQGGGTIEPGVLPILPGGAVANAKPYASSSLASGALRVAVDGAGNVWVLLANNTVTEYVGVAIPVVTPLALGVQNKKLGTKP
jgi:hypothetical protein